MEKFNYDSYMRDNPLMKETSGYGNYTKPETMLEKEDYVSAEEFDNMNDDELDAAEKSGKLTPYGAPLGSDEEVLEAEGNPKVDQFVDKIRELTQKMARSLNDQDLEYLTQKLKKWADSGFQAPSL